MIMLPKISLLILAVTIFFSAQPLEAAQKKSSKSKKSQTSAVQKKPTSKKSKAVKKKKNARKNNILPQQSSNGSPTPTPIPQLQVTVSTLAGSGTAGYADGQGTAAMFDDPTGVTVDGNGNVYVADFGYLGKGAIEGPPRIRKITPSGSVNTLAVSEGYGSIFFVVNCGVAVDWEGNVYVASGNLISKISSSGNVTLLAGGAGGYFEDGQGQSASFSWPEGLAVDGSGNVFVADSQNHAIRKISPSGNVTTLAGPRAGWSSGIAGYANGQGTEARFNYPTGVTVDGSGNVYVAEYGNNRIRKISPSGNVTTLAGSGTAGFADGQGSAAMFDYPTGVTVDGSGNVYVADFGNNRIRKITISQ